MLEILAGSYFRYIYAGDIGVAKKHNQKKKIKDMSNEELKDYNRS